MGMEIKKVKILLCGLACYSFKDLSDNNFFSNE